MQGYTYTCNKNTQRAFSPVSLPAIYAVDRPVYMVQAQNDIIPDGKLDDMVCALENAGVSSSLIKYWRIPNFEGHAFGYWDDLIRDTAPPYTSNDPKVKDRVISFFDQYLK